MVNLTSLVVNECAQIIKIECDIKIKKRLLELGFIKGANIKILAISSLKKTYLLNIQNCVLAIRESSLKGVYVCKK